MRVLITHELYPPDLAGGGEHVVQHTAEGLAALGLDVEVLTTGEPGITEYRGIRTHRLKRHKYGMNLALPEIVERARGADIIQTFTYHAALPSLLSARRVQVPVVLVCLGLFGPAWLGMRGLVLGRLWKRWEEHLLTRRYDATVFLSEFSRKQAVALGVDASRAFVACPGVESDLFRPHGPKDHKVLFVGKLHHRKGLDHVFGCAHALPDVPFEICGWGADLDALRASAPANVRFLPFQGGAPLWALMDSATIFFLPSRAETFGMAILQAMAAGCAVVSTVPLNYKGSQVAVDDRKAMIDSLRSLWNNPASTRRLGALNVGIAQQYTWKSYCEYLLRIYRSFSLMHVPDVHLGADENQCH